MPYPYGTQNSPVVGNGLGGLPRRTISTSTTRQYPVRLQAIGSAVTYSASFGLTIRSLPVPTGKNLGALVYTDGGNPKAIGFQYDPNAGIIGFASPTSALPSGAVSWNAFSFSNGMVHYGTNHGEFYKATTNGTTTSTSIFATIPSSGTLDDGSAYSSLSVIYSFGSNNLYNPVCFDALGNLVVLQRATVAGVNALCAFKLTAGGVVIAKRRLFDLNSISNARDPNAFYWIARSGAGFIVAGSVRDAAGNYMNMWNVSFDFATVTAVGPTASYSGYNSVTPSYSTFYLSSTTAAIITSDSFGYSHVWGANVNSSGAAVSHSFNNARLSTPLMGVKAYGLPYLYDPLNNLYSGPSSWIASFPTGSNNPTYFSGMSNVWTPSATASDDNMGMATLNLVAAATTDLDANGVDSSYLGYMGDGYWVQVYNIQTIYTLAAKLFKEV